ncbi:sugar isomerase domain-containing protein [Erysipelothrix aquatica]|uniref:sugar isomerase domain-containing protein n=1 Tax=Erysipelothrix aquatica TaxID=2683714 RepID=UPI00135CB8D5|nr:SIS domain-containing protein [Erysipelothrix aquatica]
MLYKDYYQSITGQLELQVNQEGKNIEAAAKVCSESVKNNRVIHVFGCGHSQMFAMEVFYRAGGIVPINALLIPHLALFPKAKLSTLQERVEGFSDQYLQLENTDAKDTMIIVSMSGRNAGVIDMALEAKKIGMKVIALTSLDFSKSVTSRHTNGKRLFEVADIVIDIKCESGDAVLSMAGVDDKFCGTSTVLGMSVMQMIMAQTVENCVNDGFKPPIYVSSNLDRGDEINAEHIANYSNLITNL